MDKLKPCPFCGGEAEINKNPLWSGNRGYKGCYEFVAVCKKCGCRVDHIKNDSIYRSEEEAQENVIKAWNKRVFQAQDVPGTNVGDAISRQAAIDALKRISFSHYFECGEYLSEDTSEIEIINSNKALEAIKALPPAQPEQDREFIKLTVRNSNGRPYYSIIYLEVDNNGVGHDFEGYSSYSLDVISDYLKKYFMSSAQPENTRDKKDVE